MQNITIGDIIFAPYPYSDILQSKNRPAVVISKNNEKDIIVAKITSLIKDDDFCFLIDATKIDFKIHKQSQIITNSINTISRKLIIKKLGRLYDKEIDAVLEKIKQNFSR